MAVRNKIIHQASSPLIHRITNSKGTKMENYNILDEIKTIAARYAVGKPEYINVTDADWEAASEETKDLLIQVQQLAKRLGDAYWEAVRRGDRQRELLLYRSMAGRPFLLSIDPGLYEESVCVERETAFIVRAKFWLREIGGLF